MRERWAVPCVHALEIWVVITATEKWDQVQDGTGNRREDLDGIRLFSGEVDAAVHHAKGTPAQDMLNAVILKGPPMNHHCAMYSWL